MILELCRKRDVKGACELLERHIHTAGRTLKESLEHRRKESQAASGKASQ